MSIITDLKPQIKNKDRTSLFIDNEFVMGLDNLTVLKFRLKIGDQIELSKIKEVAFESECSSAFEKVINYSNLRMHSKKEIEEYLKGKGYDEFVIEDTLLKLEEYKYVDDREFAEIYIRSNITKWGVNKLRYNLYKKGVDKEYIILALEQIDDFEIYAYEHALKYMRSGKDFDRNKLYAHLNSKGHESDIIKSVVRRVEKEQQE